MNARVRRIDTVSLLRSDAAIVSAEGFRTYDALFSRTGVQLYDDGNGGVVREYRPPSVVFHPDSLASFAGRPLTDLHPPRNLTTDNAHLNARGVVLSAQKHSDGRHVAGRMTVWAQSLIDKFDAAFARGSAMQLSAGYELDVKHEPGVSPDGEEFDAWQDAVLINHVAAVPLGRAGTARVLADHRGGLTDASDMFAEAWANADAAAWALADAKSLADVATRRDRTYVDLGRWSRHDATSLRIQTLDASTQETPMKKLTIKVDGKDVVLEHADNASPDQVAALVAKAYGDAAEKREASRKVELDTAVAAAVEQAKKDAAPPFGKKPEDEEKEKAAAKKDADHKAELAKVRADSEQRVDVAARAVAVMGMDYSTAGKSIEQMRLDVIETVAARVGQDGAALRKDLEATAADEKHGAIGFAYKGALKTLAAMPSHADELLTTIRGRYDAEQKGDGKPPAPAGPITKARADAEEQAALPRSQREAARKAG